MIQLGIIFIAIMASAYYLGRLIWKSFKGQTHCETGCGKCGEIQKTFDGMQAGK